MDTEIKARRYSHAAVQWLTRAARANLPAVDDDSHSSLLWNDSHDALTCLHLDAHNTVQLGFGFLDVSILFLIDGEVRAAISLADRSDRQLGEWVDANLTNAGLNTTNHIDLPYTLEPVNKYEINSDLTLHVSLLGGMYAQTHSALQTLIQPATAKEELSTTPTIRCWPHHFDMATLFTRSDGAALGIGFSPGDESYNEPYYYCSPWPFPHPDSLSVPPAPFHWHTEGFTALIALHTDIDPRQLPEALWSAVVCAEMNRK